MLIKKMCRAPEWNSFNYLAMDMKKHFSLSGSNSSIISQIFYEKPEKKSLLKTNKITREQGKPQHAAVRHLLYNNLGFTGLGPEKTQDGTFHVPSDSSYHFVIITLVGAGGREKDRHLPATLLKVCNCEEETCGTTKQELKLTDASLTWMKKNSGCDLCLKAYKHILFTDASYSGWTRSQ